LPLVVIVPALAWFVIPRLSLSAEQAAPLMHVVERQEFVHDITERGNVESAKNVEIISKVKSSSGGTTILEIVPEGTVIPPEYCVDASAVIPLEELQKYLEWRRVHEMEIADVWPAGYEAPLELALATSEDEADTPSGDTASESTQDESNGQNGDGEAAGGGAADGGGSDEPGLRASLARFANATGPVLRCDDLKGKMILVKLNAAPLETQLTQQQIVCQKSAADVTQARTALETAHISKEEYLKGTYKESKNVKEADIYMAEEDLARAEEYLDHSKLLHAKGFISDRELQAAEFDVEKRKINLEKAKTAMEVLDKYTKVKMLKQLEASIETAKARLEAETRSHELDLARLYEIEDQMVQCTIFAVAPGQVVYANERGYRSQEIVIEPGTLIRERQVIIRMPDPAQMQVKARINEARVNLVDVGMEATIRLDAFPEKDLRGVVEEVGEYPAPTSWHNANVKEYETNVKIYDPPPGLRPGFTAEVTIRVARVPDVIQVPVQAVFEHGGEHYCVTWNEAAGKVEARDVTIGRTNDKFVVIRDGLEEGERVVLNAKEYRKDLGLAKAPEGASSERSDPKGPPGEGSPRDARNARGPRPGASPRGVLASAGGGS
jgi:RND family efflux transporter MFP subunit